MLALIGKRMRVLSGMMEIFIPIAVVVTSLYIPRVSSNSNKTCKFHCMQIISHYKNKQHQDN